MEKGERRRRIIARGNDRLALITGKIQTLETEEVAKSSSFNTSHRAEDASAHHVRAASESAAPSHNSVNQEEQRKVVDHIPETVKEDDIEEASKRSGRGTAVSKEGEPGKVATRRTNRRRTASRENDQGMVVSKTPDPGKLASKGVIRKRVVEDPPPKRSPPKEEPEPEPELELIVKPHSTITLEKYLDYIINSVSLKEINFSIVTTEDIRVICTILLAVLVVLHNVTFPHNDARPESLIGYRPLYVLLLTNVFIVAVRLAPFAQRKKEGKEPLPPVAQEAGDGQDWGGALRMMELGLLLHQTFRALFIDLSFYTVIVVCGVTMA